MMFADSYRHVQLPLYELCSSEERTERCQTQDTTQVRNDKRTTTTTNNDDDCHLAAAICRINYQFRLFVCWGIFVLFSFVLFCLFCLFFPQHIELASTRGSVHDKFNSYYELLPPAWSIVRKMTAGLSKTGRLLSMFLLKPTPTNKRGITLCVIPVCAVTEPAAIRHCRHHRLPPHRHYYPQRRLSCAHERKLFVNRELNLPA